MLSQCASVISERQYSIVTRDPAPLPCPFHSAVGCPQLACCSASRLCPSMGRVAAGETAQRRRSAWLPAWLSSWGRKGRRAETKPEGAGKPLLGGAAEAPARAAVVRLPPPAMAATPFAAAQQQVGVAAAARAGGGGARLRAACARARPAIRTAPAACAARPTRARPARGCTHLM